MSRRALQRRRFIAISGALCFSPELFAETKQSPHVTAVSFTPDGKSVLVGSQAGVEIRDAESNDLLGKVGSDLDNVHDLCFSADGRILAVSGGSPGELGAVEFFDWPGGTRRQRLDAHDDVIHQVDFAADGSKWVAASADEVCSVYEWGDKKPLCRFTEHSRAVLAVVMLPDGKTVVSGSRDETLRVWDADTGEGLRTLHNHSRDVHALEVRPGGSRLPMVASASADSTVRFWQPTIGRMVRFARLPSEPLAIDWLSGGERVVAACRDGRVRLIDPTTVKIVDTVEVSSGWLYAVDVDPNESPRAVVGGSRGLLQTLELTS